MTVAFTLVIAIFLLAMLGTVVQAAGLVDDTVNVANEYSRYPLENYQLDFYVDNSWGWLPWNWSDGIGKQVMYGLYAITNFIWTISLYVSNATGYLVQEAYSLDFISATADSIGKNMQTLAGVSANGFSTEGFYVGFLLLLILVLGVYVAYTGLIKRETTKAIHAIMNFVLVFILSASFIAYAPDYIKKINDFSSDISNASLSLGTKIVMPHSDSQGKDSVDLIRDSLFSIQVQQPWLLLQYNSSDIESIGIDRVESLLSTSPDSNNGEDREKIVAEEIEDRSNTNLTITKTINRLGTVFFLFVFNIGISIFVFLLTGIMIFSQVLFIIYAMFLPVSFILSMIPSFDGMSKRAITKLFNTILTRAGITLIITTAFSISTMLYTLSAGYPFFLIAFLQIVTFAGIYFKLGDLMSMFSLQSNDSQSVGSRVMRKPRMLMHAHMHRLQRKLGRSMTTLGAGSAIVTGKKGQSGSGSSARTQADHSRPDGKEKSTLGKRIGQTIGTVADTKDRMVDTASGLKEQVKDLPTNARYAVYQGKSKVKENVRDLTSSISQTKADRASGRKEQQEQRRKPLRSVALKWNRSNRKNSLLLLFMKDRLQDKNNIMMNRPQNSLIFRLHIRNLNKPNKSVQQLSPIFQVQKWNAKAIPFKKKPFKSQQLQPLQQIELHNVQSQKNVRLLFKEYHYKIQEVDHQSKPPPLRKSVRNHEVENFSDWWFWIILDGLLTASVCCHFIFR
ncbi:Tn916 ORF15 signal peptide containing protein [Streptococcus pneumoniae]|nr:Tn916 ORF15 signal peptide containing protein [Streptococcus pneumoniae]